MTGQNLNKTIVGCISNNYSSKHCLVMKYGMPFVLQNIETQGKVGGVNSKSKHAHQMHVLTHAFLYVYAQKICMTLVCTMEHKV